MLTLSLSWERVQQLQRDLLSVAGKIVARIILNGLNEKICPNILPETQSGFRSYRSTINMVFSFRQIQEECTEQNMNI